MRFTPVYDAHNRLRVRCGDYAFTKEQACGIADLLGSLDFVEHAESNWRTGSILVMYRDGARQQVLDAVSALNRGALPEKELPAVAQADAKFAGDLEKMLVKRVLMRLLPLPVRTAITVWNGSKYMIRALDNLLQFHMNVAVLDGTAIGASMFSGNMSTASSVMFLLGLSDMLEDYTRQRTKLALSEQLALHVDNVWVETPEGTRQIPFDQVQVGDRILVQTGSVIPFDGTVCGNVAMVNQSTMTGESEPVHKKEGDSVFAGTTVEDGKLLIEVRTLSDGSRLQEIIGLIDQSENLKAGVQSKAEHLADSIVPYSFLGFALTALLTGNMTRAISVLMVDFSCAIKLSTPISVISAMREAAEHGTAVKGGKYLEAYAAADTIVFDKTGTLTNACPKVTDIVLFRRKHPGIHPAHRRLPGGALPPQRGSRRRGGSPERGTESRRRARRGRIPGRSRSSHHPARGEGDNRFSALRVRGRGNPTQRRGQGDYRGKEQLQLHDIPCDRRKAGRNAGHKRPCKKKPRRSSQDCAALELRMYAC